MAEAVPISWYISQSLNAISSAGKKMALKITRLIILMLIASLVNSRRNGVTLSTGDEKVLKKEIFLQKLVKALSSNPQR